MFQPVKSGMWYVYVFGSIILVGILLAVLSLLPRRAKRQVVLLVTLLGGLFYALEFFLPTHPMQIGDDPAAEGNFLTPYIVPMANILPAIAACAVGLGVINLFQLHGKRTLKRNADSINSIAFFISCIGMAVVWIMAKQPTPSPLSKALGKILFEGALQSLDATMFSIIAFYITSAAYRAFRVRSLEATLLLATAIIVMLGQITVGQLLTAWIPKQFDYLHVEVIRNWILTKINAPATRAIAIGLGIGSLAVGLRIWLGLERGSYFDE